MYFRTVVFALLSLGLAVGASSMSSAGALETMWAVLLVQLIALVGLFIHGGVHRTDLLNPLLLGYLYVNVSLVLGNAYDVANLLKGARDAFAIPTPQHADLSLIYWVLCNGAVGGIALWSSRVIRSRLPGLVPARSPRLGSRLYALVAAVTLSVAVVLKLALPTSNFTFLLSSVASVIGVTTFAWLVSKERSVSGAMVLVLVVAAASLVFYNEKRLILLFLFSVGFSFLMNASKPRPFGLAIGISLLGAVGVFLVLAMSLLRGYGGYGDIGVVEMPGLIVEYVSSPEFLIYAGMNFEFSVFYIHAMNSMEILISNTEEHIKIGSTILRAVLVFVQVDGVPKPDSIIHAYTTVVSPEFRARGGSWPMNLYAEMFWNFHVFGVMAMIAVSMSIHALYHKIVQTAWIDGYAPSLMAYLVIYYMFFFYVRGSGLDIYVVYVVVALVILSPFVLVLGRRTPVSTKRAKVPALHG